MFCLLKSRLGQRLLLLCSPWQAKDICRGTIEKGYIVQLPWDQGKIVTISDNCHRVNGLL